MTINLGPLQDATLRALPLIRDEIERLISNSSHVEGNVMGTLKNLFKFQSERGQAAMYLVSSGYVWDSEIILRAYCEASVRIMFICSASDNDRSTLIDEFWNVLGGIDDRRRALKAEFAESLWRNKDEKAATIFSALQDPKIFQTQPQANKAARKSIEQKWSFSEIINTLSNDKAQPEKDLRGLLYSYALASHFLHADAAALDLMHDQFTRPPNERELLIASHICRVFNDIVSFGYMCAESLRTMLGSEFENEAKLVAAVVACHELSAPIDDAFYASQADFYRTLGRTEFD